MPRVIVDPSHARGIALEALSRGASATSAISTSWDVAGRCTDPVPIEIAGRRRDRQSYYVDLDVACRKCEACRKSRRWLWTNRAKVEVAAAARTWFGTLTLRPEEHMKALAAYVSKGGDYIALSADQRFAARHKWISRQITLWLKRVRKETGANIRYLLVAESHDSERTSEFYRGLPHYHCLIHEPTLSDVVPKRVLQRQWWHGHSAVKLVADGKAPHYVCKYLSKDTKARVRASVHYGVPPTVVASS